MAIHNDEDICPRDYRVTRADGKEEPGAVYFVLRLDRPNHWWDSFGRGYVQMLGDELAHLGNPWQREFGENLVKWVKGLA